MGGSSGSNFHLWSNPGARLSAFQLLWWHILAHDDGNWEKHRDLIPDNDEYETWQFSRLHKITLGIINRDMEQELLEPDIDVDSTDSAGMTALSWASCRGDSKATALLLNAGASVDIPDARGFTPLMFAWNLPCSKLFLEAGANPRAVNPQKWSTLHLLPYRFTASNVLEVVCLLLAKGAALEARNAFGSSPLHASINPRRQQLQWVNAFLDCGADVDSVDNDGDTSLNNAIFYQIEGCVTLLLSRGATYNLINKNGDSTLHMAAKYGNLEVVKALDAANLQDIDTEILNKQRKSARQEVLERESKPEGFLDKFDELLTGIRTRFRNRHFNSASGSPGNDAQVGDEDEFFNALEQQ